MGEAERGLPEIKDPLTGHAGHPYARDEAKRPRFVISLVPALQPAGLYHLHAYLSTATQNANSSARLAFAGSS
jgi:hypothetical protein